MLDEGKAGEPSRYGFGPCCSFSPRQEMADRGYQAGLCEISWICVQRQIRQKAAQLDDARAQETTSDPGLLHPHDI